MTNKEQRCKVINVTPELDPSNGETEKTVKADI